MNAVAMERFRRSLRQSLFIEIANGAGVCKDDMGDIWQCEASLEELDGQAIPTFLDLEMWLEFENFRAGFFTFNLVFKRIENDDWDETWVVYQAECEAY